MKHPLEVKQVDDSGNKRKYEDYTPEEKKKTWISIFIGLIIIWSVLWLVFFRDGATEESSTAVSEPAQTEQKQDTKASIDLAEKVEEKLKEGYHIDSFAELNAEDAGHKLGYVTSIENTGDGGIMVTVKNDMSDTDHKLLSGNVFRLIGEEVPELKKVSITDATGKVYVTLREDIPLLN